MTSLDYYGIEELLTDEERAARDRARRFVQEEAMPEIVPCHRAGKFPDQLIPRMGELGFFAPYLKEHGCAGVSYTGFGLMMQELERGDSGLRSLASVQGALAIYAIHSFGTAEQHARWLPGLASGERVGCFALTEHGHGSDPGGMETRATGNGDHYILNGSKCWIGNCRIPAEDRLPKASGLRAPLSCLSQARVGVAWGVIGAAIDCYETTLAYAKSREQFGRAIAGFQLVQEKLVWMVQEITKAQLLALRLTRLMEEGKALL